MLDTLTLKIFITLADSHSFTKTASIVGRTQSAVSQQISKLEDFLGKRLFQRDNKNLKLTHDGEIFFSYAKEILALHLEALDRFKNPELEGEVRFGVPEDFASFYLADVLSSFISIHPRILLHVDCDLTLNLYSRFKNKEFDLVLVKMPKPDDFPNGQEVWSEPLSWVNNGKTIDLTKPIPLVLAPSPCVYRNAALTALQQSNTRFRINFISSSYASTIAAVNAGMGITVMPKTMIPNQLKFVQANTLPLLDNLHVSLLIHKDSSPAVNSFAEFVIPNLNFK